MERPFFERVAIVGVGLIGGSLALDMKRLGLTGHVMGVGRGVENLKIAEERGIVDRWTTELTHGVEGCGLVVVAVPVKSVAKVVGAMMPALEEGTIVTDVGSVKERIIEEVEPLLKEGVSFVPAHPIAGTEHSGAQAAFTGLFKDRKCILTPTPNTNPAALETVKRLWQEVGSQVVIMDAGMHDVILAGVSHLFSCAASDSWLASVQDSAQELPSPLTKLTERLHVFRFRPGTPRVLTPLFQGIAGRLVALEIEDPWCGVRPHNRRRLASFVAAANNAGIGIARLTVVWNPTRGEPDTPQAQSSALRAELRSAGITVTPEFHHRSGRDRHFHDRVVTIQSVDDGARINLRWDVTAGIDNLMSRSKECSVFIEER